MAINTAVNQGLSVAGGAGLGVAAAEVTHQGVERGMIDFQTGWLVVGTGSLALLGGAFVGATGRVDIPQDAMMMMLGGGIGLPVWFGASEENVL